VPKEQPFTRVAASGMLTAKEPNSETGEEGLAQSLAQCEEST
jgi:hypothetical protein